MLPFLNNNLYIYRMQLILTSTFLAALTWSTATTYIAATTITP